MLRHYRLWLSMGWLMVAMVCYVTLMPNPPDIDVEFEYIDKVEHFLSYFILMFWFSQLYQTDQSRYICVLFFIFMGAALEVLQGLGGVRFFEYYDMLANSMGVITAWFVSRGQLKNVLLCFEKKMHNND